MSPPRYFSDPHPNRAGTLADVWVPWIEHPEGGNIQLRPWQRLFLDRMLEIDADGNLCWLYVVLTTPRQSGKSFVLKALAMARAHFADRFGETQTVLHLSNNLASARRIILSQGRWAEEQGLRIYRTFGAERISWPDGSDWQVLSSTNVYGASGSLVLLDEAFDVPIEAVDNAITPVLLERSQPQLMITSTANPLSTDLLPHYRKIAIAGSDEVMIAEWSADPRDDPADVDTWQSASPHWTAQREKIMRGQLSSSGFKYQYLNIWSSATIDAPQQWPQGWGSCPRSSREIPSGGVAAMESTVLRSHYGVAYAVRNTDGSVSTWSDRFATQVQAVEWMQKWNPARTLVGLSLKKELPHLPCDGVGASETFLATPFLADLVARGRLYHDHNVVVADQTMNARLNETERGVTLSGKKSKGAVDALKALSWAVYFVSQDVPQRPQIWA